MEKSAFPDDTGMDDDERNHAPSDGNQKHDDPLKMTAQPRGQAQPKSQQKTLTLEQQIELSELVLKSRAKHSAGSGGCPHHSHQGPHSHGHHFQGGHPKGNNNIMRSPERSVQVMAAALALVTPLEELVKGTPQEIMGAFNTLLRLGQYEKWEGLATTLIVREKENPPLPTETKTGNHDQDSSKSSFHIPTNTKTWWLWIDSNGHTLLHWAAKRGDDKRFVEYFMNHAPTKILQELLHTRSRDKIAMTPLHWACTEPGAQSLWILSLFIVSSGVDVDWESTDASGCTPLLIAAQYGQVEVCAYLLQMGRANLYATDASLDTALHWASYKGSLPVCGLLWWYHEQRKEREGRHASRGDLMAPDRFGQTPLHLAALRGHTSVVRWLLHRTCPTKQSKMELLLHKDSKGRSPLNLAIHANRPTVQQVLQEEQDKAASFNARESLQWRSLQRRLTKSAKQMTSVQSWKLWLGISDVTDEMDEAPQFPSYYLWGQGLMHVFIWYPLVFCPLHHPSTGLLWDFPFWHLLNVMNFLVCGVTLLKTTYTNPGSLAVEDEKTYKQMPKDHKKVVDYWRKLYESTLESYATTTDMQSAIKSQVL
jgi:palmitoyltransferase ZDHHC13/17